MENQIEKRKCFQALVDMESDELLMQYLACSGISSLSGFIKKQPSYYLISKYFHSYESEFEEALREFISTYDTRSKPKFFVSLDIVLFTVFSSLANEESNYRVFSNLRQIIPWDTCPYTKSLGKQYLILRE